MEGLSHFNQPSIVEREQASFVEPEQAVVEDFTSSEGLFFQLQLLFRSFLFFLL
jgi:hypothetical protein